MNMKTVTALMEAAVECIPTKLRAKYTVLWKSLIVRKKRDNKKASLSNKENPTFAITQKLRKAQKELTNT